MPESIAARDLQFLLFEVLDAGTLPERERFADYDRATFEAFIDTAQALAATHYAPSMRRNDTEEPELVDGRVRLIPEVAEAYQATAAAGLLNATHDANVGGLQLPHLVHTAAWVHLDAANIGTAAYALLTAGAANVIRVFGTPDQQATYLEPMFTGRYTGTMCLTEADAGSSLADLRTTATPVGDGTYRITGTKVWISGGEHELGENIVHLVLARIAGAPAGVKGISLFIVPRRRREADGHGVDNGIALGGLIHKMGWRGTVSTILNFGEHDACIGDLIGPPHQGLACMFHMMNEARIGVGRAATAMGYAAYTYALEYARQRRQGRLPGERDATSPPVPLTAHADVRRLLLHQKSVVEGALALILECARLVDDQETHPDPDQRTRATRLLDVLTPIAKAWPADACQESISYAIQVLGGYGFAREYPVEQLYRDNRLNAIHEGTNGIQALDLLGRKVRQDNGAGFAALVEAMHETAAATQTAGLAALGDLPTQFRAAVERLVAVTQALGRASATEEPALVLANASVYLDLASRTVVAWLWLRQALVAARALPEAGAHDVDFYQGKLQAARYWFGWELPKTEPAAALLERLDPTPFAMQDAWF